MRKQLTVLIDEDVENVIRAKAKQDKRSNAFVINALLFECLAEKDYVSFDEDGRMYFNG